MLGWNSCIQTRRTSPKPAQNSPDYWWQQHRGKKCSWRWAAHMRTENESKTRFQFRFLPAEQLVQCLLSLSSCRAELQNALDSNLCLQDVKESNTSATGTRAPQTTPGSKARPNPICPNTAFFHLFPSCPWDLWGGRKGGMWWHLCLTACSAGSTERHKTAQANKRNHSLAGSFLQTKSKLHHSEIFHTMYFSITKEDVQVHLKVWKYLEC